MTGRRGVAVALVVVGATAAVQGEAQAGVALGELDRDARGDRRALARGDRAALERVEV